MQVLVGGSGFIAPRILAGRRTTSNVWLNRVHTKVASTPSEREEGPDDEREEGRELPVTASEAARAAARTINVDFDELVIVGSAVGFSFLGALAILILPPVIEQSDQMYYFDTSLSPGDFAGAALWTLSYYFVSPLQLLLLFLGRIETTRPSDAIMKLGGQVLGRDTEALGYEPSAGLKAAAVLACVVQGIVTSLLFELALEDATWSVSTGIGSVFAAFVYEVGRPKRLSSSQEIELEAVWLDFASFADAALVKSGRCHETDVFREFRRRFGKYRTEDRLSDAVIRDMIKNWNPRVQRSRNGYYANLSVGSRISDSF